MLTDGFDHTVGYWGRTRQGDQGVMFAFSPASVPDDLAAPKPADKLQSQLESSPWT